MSDLQQTILTKVTSLEVSILGHPDNPHDTGMFGEIKRIRELAEQTNGRVDRAEIAIHEINARCEERHGIGHTLEKRNQSDQREKRSLRVRLAAIVSSASALGGLVYIVGCAVGWW